MIIKNIGAFEAKTHFSQLLNEVEAGAVIHITRRGKSVAILTSENFHKTRNSIKALERISKRRKNINEKQMFSIDDIQSFRNEGAK